MRSPKPLRLSSRAAGTALFILGEIGLITAQAHAGDILRGGRPTGAPSGANNPTGTAPPPVVPTGGTTRDSLARTAQAMQAAQAMQLAARNVANGGANHANNNPSGNGIQLPNVPDGLGQGGLQVDGRVTGANSTWWKGAELPTQTTGENGQTKVNIVQTAQQALLNWDTFNVGKNTTLTFDQSAGGANKSQWIAFNQVNDPLANPTQILGKIEAPGQVYILNRNGIVFGGSSQVNTHTLTASTLPINTNLVDRGLINNPDLEFLFSSMKTGSFDPALPANSRIGDVIVEAGAQLTSPSSAEKVGGRIALIGANVSNAGTISTADGQTILAAGLQVALEAHQTSDPSLRGLDVYIGAVVDPASTLTPYAGTVTNTGIIDAPRANVTMAGKDVRQMGMIHSTTSVSFNGRVDLIAEYNSVRNPNYPKNPVLPYLIGDEGTVTLGEGSVTRILPELDSKETVVGSELALRSQVNIRGQQIHLDDNSVIYAPNAKVEVNAGEWFADASGRQTFVRTGGRIDLDAGALIDVSGSKNVASSVTSNIVRVELRGTELADSPLLRDGPLRGQTIYVDLTETGTYNGKTWVGTPLADVSGYVNLVQRTVGELTAAGGSVNLSAGDSVVIRKGAGVDVSGGWINYAGGVVKTTQVFANGKIYDIADATPDRAYGGIWDGSGSATSIKWGTSYRYDHPVGPDGSRYQDGYTQGGSGGTLKVSAAGMALDGQLSGSVYTGVRQRQVGPTASSLSLSFTAERYIGDNASPIAPSAPTVTFLGGVNQADIAEGAAIPAERLKDFYLDPSLIGADNFGSLAIDNPDGDIVVPENVTLQAAPAGSIALTGANITVNGSVLARGGNLSFTAYNQSPQDVVDLRFLATAVLPAADPERGHFQLGEHAVISTAGLIVDDRPTSAGALSSPLITTGGTVKISSYSADLAAGGLIDVSGGLQVDGRGRVSYGNAGSLSILTGRDLNITGVTGGQLNLGATLRGISGAKGGTLALQANAVQVGGASAPANVLHLDPSFFNEGGFASFAISGIGVGNGVGSAPLAAVSIADGTVIRPVVSSVRVDSVAGDGPLQLVEFVKPEGLRTPLSLSFTGLGATNEFEAANLIHRGDVREGAGAVIDAGPAGSITLAGGTVEVQGSLIARGGSIRLSGANALQLPTGGNPAAAQATVWIGQQAVIDASGTTVLVPDAFGRRRGAVLAGGSITASGNILAEAGALLDVSGSSGTLDLLAGESGQSLADIENGASGTTTKPYPLKTRASLVESNGGTITLTGGQMLLSDATLHGAAGGETAAGGTLKVSSGRFYLNPLSASPFFDPTLVVTNAGQVIPASLHAGIGAAFDTDATGISGGGRFSADDFASGGFSNLDLGGVVRFSGDVTIAAKGRITAGSNPALYADGAVNLSASHLVFGAAFQAPQLATALPVTYQNAAGTRVTLPPSFGTGSLNASASLIEVGNVSLQGIGNANLVAENGDIRGSGILAMAGHLGLKAGQIYPPTGTSFTLAAVDYTQGGTNQRGSITIEGSGTRHLPLSAGGTLSIYASQIEQNGTLRAPFGTIHLGWDGSGTAPADASLTGLTFTKTLELTLGSKSVTSVSAIDPITGKGVIIPYGVSTNGSNWIDPGGNDITSSGLPQKSLQVAAESVVTEAGSVIDVRGGGDLMAYRFESGLGGTVDILASTGAYAVVPSYGSEFAPYAPFNPSTGATALNGNPGYINSTLHVGDQVRLDGGGGLPAGVYTLLPARYALLPGAFLVTPLSGSAQGTIGKPDGSAIVSGYRFNGLEQGYTIPDLATRFEVARPEVIAKRAEYTRFSANGFFPTTGSLRLPGDAGQLVLAATKQMALAGSVTSSGDTGFRGGLVDISSASDIFINDGTGSGPAGALTLDASLLSSFGSASLLIGGTRSTTAEGSLVTANTGSITLDNGSDALSGREIILVAKNSINLAAGSTLEQTGAPSAGGDTLVIGTEGTANSGNGALVRVSANTGSGLIRHGVTPGGTVTLGIGAGATVRGASLTLDSTGKTTLDPSAVLQGDALSISSGRISLALNPAVTPGADAGLVLTNATLQGFANASDFALASYSSIDLLGAGVVGGVDGSGNPLIDALTLRAAEIRGLGQGSSGTVTINAGTVRLAGQAGATLSTPVPANGGSLVIQADSVELGAGSLALNGFAQTRLEAGKRLQATANGSLSASGDLTVDTPVVLAANAVKSGISAAGALRVSGSGSTGTVSGAGLGSSFSFTGASVDLASRVVLPSGEIIVRATSGNVNIDGQLEAGGAAHRFRDQTRFSDGGRISLTADHGSLTLGQHSVLDVSAQNGGGDAGSLSLSAAQGSVSFGGTLSAAHGSKGQGGSFSMDVASLASLGNVDAMLNAASYDVSRTYRVRSGDVAIDGLARSHSYQVSADAGSITLSNTIDASGATGGDVRLVAGRNLTLASGSLIDASGDDFDSAGQGGAVVLETRGNSGGTLQLNSGSSIDLSVASSGGATADAAKGHFTGTLHLRAPRVAGDMAIGSLASTVTGASHIIAEGYQVYDLTASGGAITSAVQNSVKTDATAFMANAGAIESRILTGNSGLGSILTVRPGAELVNTTGDLTLGAANLSGANGDWNLASFRFGGEQVPGILTLRAAGNLVFLNSLSDGFTNGAYNSSLLARNELLPENVQAWSYRLSAGADFSAADTLATKALDQLGASSGNVLLGKDNGVGTVAGAANAKTATAMSFTSESSLYQVIRTGGGSIDIAAGRDIQLLSPAASIYTAGTLVKDPTLGGTFAKPVPTMVGQNAGTLGSIQQDTPAAVQYSVGGGNVNLHAGNDIAHYVRNALGVLVADSSREMPTNWLYRRGYVDPTTGEFGKSFYGETASTTWWVDFTNFFEGIGALGGGNVTLTAGRDISNVDAVAPTNARMPGGKPDASKLVELGGGDVTVRAGRNIDAGVYYVERGHGELSAGGSIITNATRSPSLGTLRNPAQILDPSTWLATTLFVGKADFDVSAGGDLLLGPVANPFLLPQGYNNTYWYKTYFSTYGENSGVSASSLGGSLTFRTDGYANVNTSVTKTDPALVKWYDSQLRQSTSSAANLQPWLRLAESNTSPFTTVAGLMPGSLRGTAFSGDIKLAGDITLSPSRHGSLELMAAGSLNGFQAVGANVVSNRTVLAWTSSRITMSDVDPASLLGVANPYAYQTLVGTGNGSGAQNTQATPSFFAFYDAFFAETGSTNGNLQQKQGLHASSLLHAGDSDPVRLYADGGDLSGLSLFSPKAARVLASRDIRDIALYLQNLSADDLSVVAAGRDIIAYDSTTAGRVAGRTGNNQTDASRGPNAGDIQISGPGTLEVLAGRNLDLGIGGNNADGTGTGITSIGNGRNPALPFEGAEIFAAAGIGDATSFDDSKADFPAFITKYVKGGEGTDHLKELKLTQAEFDALDPEEQKQVALKVFFFVLRDAGRDHNDPDSPGFGNYDAGKDAVALLFPGNSWQGNIDTRSRDIRTRSGGDITLLLPGGSLTLATSVQSNILAPPGIITESGGAIRVFTDKNVDLGISRIFTLRGGDEIIWSTRGNIAAGSSSKTVQSAPPTRVLIDPQSADVRTDLAGLATGGGIGVLTTVAGVDPADVDLVAPEGTIDAGDAGIRVSGNLNIAAAVVVNASNISVGGSSAGAAPSGVSAPSVSAVTSASNNSSAAGNTAANQSNNERAVTQEQVAETPSVITAEVIGYGGSADGAGSSEDEEDKDKDKEKKDGEGEAVGQ